MTKLQERILSMASPSTSCAEIAQALDCDSTTVRRLLLAHKAPMRARKSRQGVKPDSLTARILALADGIRSSKDIAGMLGCSPKTVQSTLKVHQAPKLTQGAQRGEANHFYIDGRSVELDGYALVAAPPGHPNARGNRILEHRLVMEQKLGRYLLPTEIVDHIDGLHLHNAPSNLQLFASNREHLRATIAGFVPRWSASGLANMRAAPALRASLERVDTYRLRKARGDIRLLQILLAALQLGIDSPYLLGTHRHLARARIDYSSPTTIERALAELFDRFAADRAR